MKSVKLTLLFLSSLAQCVVSTTIQPRVTVPGADTPEFYLVSSSQNSQANLLVRQSLPILLQAPISKHIFKSAFAFIRRHKWIRSAHRLRAHWRVLRLSRQIRGSCDKQPESFFARIDWGDPNLQRMQHIRPARFHWIFL
jgi:hypothetical protein